VKAPTITHPEPLASLLDAPSKKYVYDLRITEEAGFKTLWLSCFRPGTLFLVR